VDKTNLEARTRAFAVEIIRFVGTINRTQASYVVVNQMVRSGTSVGANCKEASRAESRRDFIHKLALAEKEAAESQYWLEICRETAMGEKKRLEHLVRERREILAILVTIGRRTKNG